MPWTAPEPAHAHDHAHGHDHSHGLVDDSIKRSRAGVRAVAISLAILGLTTVVQAVVFIASGSVALLADVIHNAGDARVDAYVSLGVIATAAVVALGLDIADPLIGLGISLLILRITWQSWRTVREA
jgi:divalent metal cation (Fe/Co/Zn/Cd) transporter